MDLDPGQRRHLRALAHPLRPVVQAFRPKNQDFVLSPAQLAEVDRRLGEEELVKVKLRGARTPEMKQAITDQQAHTGAAWVQTIGHTVVLYRAHPSEPQIQLPAPKPPARAGSDDNADEASSAE